MASVDLSKIVQGQFNAILDDLDLQPSTYPHEHPLRDICYYYAVRPAVDIKEQLRSKLAEPGSDQPNSAYWQTLWRLVIDTTEVINNLSNLELWVREQVLKALEEVIPLSEELRKVEVEDDSRAPVTVQPDVEA